MSKELPKKEVDTLSPKQIKTFQTIQTIPTKEDLKQTTNIFYA